MNVRVLFYQKVTNHLKLCDNTGIFVLTGKYQAKHKKVNAIDNGESKSFSLVLWWNKETAKTAHRAFCCMHDVMRFINKQYYYYYYY